MRLHGPIAACLLILAGCESREESAAPAAAANNMAAADPLPPGVDPPAHPVPTRASAIPAPFHGVYAASPAACAMPHDSRLAVSARELRFHESAGAVRSVTIDSPDSIHVAADYHGEGQSWSETRQLRLSEGGRRLTVTVRGSGSARVRCGSAPAPAPAPDAGWAGAASGEGAALYLARAGGGRVVTLFCPANSRDLLVNVPGFRSVGSEERMTFGAGGTAVTLVADPGGDRQRGGVSGRGRVPAELPAILAGRIAVNYGSQNSGPHAAPPAHLARSFIAACRGRAAAAPPPARTPAGPAGACMMQGSERLAVAPLRAVGTEPFWAAQVEGRCVTYSHPEDQRGTRVWTRFTAGAGGGTWSGALGGRRFELTVRPQAGCSDGMSDTRYPLRAELLVGGERRTGCAAPR